MAQAGKRNGLARIIHDGSSRNRAVASRDGRVEPRGTEAYLIEYVEGLSGEPARLHAAEAACRLVVAANPGYPLLCLNATGEQQKRS